MELLYTTTPPATAGHTQIARYIAQSSTSKIVNICCYSSAKPLYGMPITVIKMMYSFPMEKKTYPKY